MRKKGFTLIELLAVIVILAIILAISIPTISGLIENSREDSLKASLRTVIKKAQTTAVTSGITSGYISDLDISNKNLSGTWSYDDSTKKTTVCGLSDDKVGIVGNNGCVTSGGDITISTKSFSNLKIVDIFNFDKLNNYGRVENNFILDNDSSPDTQPNNYIWYSGRLWRAYKKDSTGVFLITQSTQTTIPYATSAVNFSGSFPKTWLNETYATKDGFYKTLTDTSIIMPSTYGDVSANVGLISFADYNNILSNDSLSGNGRCIGYWDGIPTPEYKTQYDCENTGYICSDSQYTDQTSCESVGYCSGMTLFQFTQYDGNESECYNNGGWYNDPYCYYFEYVDHPEYNNDPSGCSGAGYDFNGGWNSWTPKNYWSFYSNEEVNYINSHSSTWTLTNAWTDYRYVISADGWMGTTSMGAYGIRPVIKVDSNAVIKSGNGTLNIPYILGNPIAGNQQNGTYKVGEYIKMGTVLNSNQLWRIQEVSGSNLRLVASDIYFQWKSPEGKFDTGGSQNFNISSSKAYMNTPGNLFTSDQINNKFIDSTFYLGTMTGSDYSTTKTSPITTKIGLPRIGEMFVSLDMNGTNNSYSYGGFFAVNSCIVDSGGLSCSSSNPQYTYGLRPVVTISNSNIGIGNGTLNNPYTVK